MANPFKSDENLVQPVTNSELYCEKCALVVDNGLYYPNKKQLMFICPNKHVNKVTVDLD